MNHWFLAIRPKTLWASIAPVLIGTAMAVGNGVQHFPSALAALLSALLIQIGTNLANDYFDSLNGVDAADRKGPVRVTQSGLIAPSQVKSAFILCFFFAALIAVYLVWRAGHTVIIIGVLSILSGLLYTAGPKPLSHLGLGEIFVLIFFGPVAVSGTYFVQSFECPQAVLMASLAPGFFSTAVLAVNNLRDIDTDRRAGKKTLAVRLGKQFARMEYLICVGLACCVPVIVYIFTQKHPFTIGASFLFLTLVPTVQVVFLSDKGEDLNNALAQTGRILFLYSIIIFRASLI